MKEYYTLKMLRDTLRAFEHMKARGEFVEIHGEKSNELKL